MDICTDVGLLDLGKARMNYRAAHEAGDVYAARELWRGIVRKWGVTATRDLPVCN